MIHRTIWYDNYWCRIIECKTNKWKIIIKKQTSDWKYFIIK